MGVRLLVSHPISVVLYFGLMYVFFLTPFIGFAMAHMEVMDLVNLTFLFGDAVLVASRRSTHPALEDGILREEC